MKFLYKQAEFSYQKLIEEIARRNGQGFELELLQTGACDDDQYFYMVIQSVR